MDIQERVHVENARAHDDNARTHDRAVPYIRRQRTRDYYWSLIAEACGGVEHFGNARVLELGCGTGTFADLCLQAGCASYTGIDLSPGMIARARAKCPDPRATFDVVSLERFADSAPAAFDIILSSSFLHHLVDLRGCLEQIRSMLDSGGVYVALHEVNTEETREEAVVERIDEFLQVVLGFSAYGTMPRRQRLAKLFTVLLTPGTGHSGEDHHHEHPDGGDGPDYVDYQLNKPFSLRRLAGDFGEVRPYCYLAFPELFALGRPLNHEMLIMRREGGSG